MQRQSDGISPGAGRFETSVACLDAILLEPGQQLNMAGCAISEDLVPWLADCF
jgi:hypothetical protein